jgi:hypothetical protein
MGKKPDLDEPTLRVLGRMLNTPPKPHDEMKIGRRRKRTVTKRPSADDGEGPTAYKEVMVERRAKKPK